MELLLNTPSSIGFNEIKALVLNHRCLNCHDSEEKAGGLDLSDYKALMNSKIPGLIEKGDPMESGLYTSLIVSQGSRMMPPEGTFQLTKSQVQLVYQWIKGGAREKANEKSDFASLAERIQPFLDRPETIDYEAVQNFVFKPGRCYECHSTKGMRPDPEAIMFAADMSSYENLFLEGAIRPGIPIRYDKNKPDKIVTGSSIYQAIAIDQSMPPAKEGHLPLSGPRVELLRLWILNCAIKKYDGNPGNFSSPNSMPGKVRNCY